MWTLQYIIFFNKSQFVFASVPKQIGEIFTLPQIILYICDDPFTRAPSIPPSHRLITLLTQTVLVLLC